MTKVFFYIKLDVKTYPSMTETRKALKTIHKLYFPYFKQIREMGKNRRNHGRRYFVIFKEDEDAGNFIKKFKWDKLRSINLSEGIKVSDWYVFKDGMKHIHLKSFAESVTNK